MTPILCAGDELNKVKVSPTLLLITVAVGKVLKLVRQLRLLVILAVLVNGREDACRGGSSASTLAKVSSPALAEEFVELVERSEIATGAGTQRLLDEVLLLAGRKILATRTAGIPLASDRRLLRLDLLELLLNQGLLFTELGILQKKGTTGGLNCSSAEAFRVWDAPQLTFLTGLYRSAGKLMNLSWPGTTRDMLSIS